MSAHTRTNPVARGWVRADLFRLNQRMKDGYVKCQDIFDYLEELTPEELTTAKYQAINHTDEFNEIEDLIRFFKPKPLIDQLLIQKGNRNK